MQPTELLQRMKSKKQPVVLDVRSGFEFRGGHIQGAIHAPTMKILLGLISIPGGRDAELVVTCEHGPRAALARGVLALRGYRNVTLLCGHMHGWRRAKHPQVKT